jgi:hypothetical protein
MRVVRTNLLRHVAVMDDAWWKLAVVYQVHPRSFADGNGDGVGDLPGLLAHLDHIAWLGADAIWLSPVNRPPMANMGDDVQDYCDIDPLFGSRDDLDGVVAACHESGLRLLFDLVPNHTSDQHPWFVASRSSRNDPSGTGTRGGTRDRTARHPTTGCRPSRRGRPPGPSTRPPASTTCTSSSPSNRPELGEAGGPGGHTRRDALLARPRHRRLPHRRHPRSRARPRRRRSAGDGGQGAAPLGRQRQRQHARLRP